VGSSGALVGGQYLPGGFPTPLRLAVVTSAPAFGSVLGLSKSVRRSCRAANNVRAYSGDSAAFSVAARVVVRFLTAGASLLYNSLPPYINNAASPAAATDFLNHPFLLAVSDSGVAVFPFPGEFITYTQQRE
jgi:hypothetical protein